MTADTRVDNVDQGMQANLDAVGSMVNYCRWIYDTVAPHLGSSVLEVGCGNGNLASHLVRTPGLRRYVGVDHSPTLCEELRARLGEEENIDWEVLTMAVENPAFARLARTPFDAVVCLNVLEHIEDDAAMLRRFASAVRPGGKLLLLVPAHPRLYGSIDRVVAHVRRYTKRDLRDKIVRAGLSVHRLRYFNLFGIPAWIWHGQVLKLTVHRQGEMRSWDRLVPWLQWLEDYVPIPAGLSLFAVAQRPPNP